MADIKRTSAIRRPEEKLVRTRWLPLTADDAPDRTRPLIDERAEGFEQVSEIGTILRFMRCRYGA